MCDCDQCQFNKKYQDELDKLPPDAQAFFSDVYDQLAQAETDVSYYRCIVNGVWPNSDEIIAQARKKQKQ